jgi:hypothetical protein
LRIRNTNHVIFRTIVSVNCNSNDLPAITRKSSLIADRQAAFAHGQAFYHVRQFNSLFTPALTGADQPLLLFIERVA